MVSAPDFIDEDPPIWQFPGLPIDKCRASPGSCLLPDPHSPLLDPTHTISIVNPRSITAIDNTLVALRDRDWFDITGLDRGDLTTLLADPTNRVVNPAEPDSSIVDVLRRPIGAVLGDPIFDHPIVEVSRGRDGYFDTRSVTLSESLVSLSGGYPVYSAGSHVLYVMGSSWATDNLVVENPGIVRVDLDTATARFLRDTSSAAMPLTTVLAGTYDARNQLLYAIDEVGATWLPVHGLYGDRSSFDSSLVFGDVGGATRQD